jgi:uncharacterized protein YqjF (DUF2071 family)
MEEQNAFVSARWKNLIMVSYDVSRKVLTPYLPDGLELDTFNDRAYVSLIGFDFLDLRVMGVNVPFLGSFPEINLRFYVVMKKKDNEKHGVVFIREFAPKNMVTFSANLLYNENYRTVPIETKENKKDGRILKTYLMSIDSENYLLDVEAEDKADLPGPQSIEQFLKERPWGFGKSKSGETIKYRVEHPKWNIHPIIKFNKTFDLGKAFGSEWEFLNRQDPANVMFVEGSEIKIYPYKKLEAEDQQTAHTTI